MNLISIDDTSIDNAIRFLESDSEWENWEPTSISLGASLELAYWCQQKKSPKCGKAAELLSKSSQYLDEIRRLLMGGSPRVPTRDYEALTFEFFAIRQASDLLNLSWEQFLSRFRTSLKQSGFADRSGGIAGALQEMADNVAQHSIFGHSELALNGVAGYCVKYGAVEFVVGDGGIGALATLRNNTRWAALKSSREALLAIAQGHASRRADQGEGQGYRELFGALASFDGLVRLRSGNGIFSLSGSIGRSTPSGSNVPHIQGFQLTVKCRVRI